MEQLEKLEKLWNWQPLSLGSLYCQKMAELEPVLVRSTFFPSDDSPFINPGVSLENITMLFNWLVVYLPIWEIWVNWDDYSQYFWKHKSHVPNHQPDIYIYINPNKSPFSYGFPMVFMFQSPPTSHDVGWPRAWCFPGFHNRPQALPRRR